MDSLTSILDVTVWTPMSWDYRIKIKNTTYKHCLGKNNPVSEQQKRKKLDIYKTRY